MTADHPLKTPAKARSTPLVIRERVWWLLPLVLWAAAVGLSLTLQVDKIREQSTLVAVEGARNMFRMVMLTRNWNASHGGVYVPVTPETQPNPYRPLPGHRSPGHRSPRQPGPTLTWITLGGT